MGQCVSKNTNETRDEDDIELLTFKNLGKGVYGYTYMSNGKVMKHIF
jgi:hypothetical protein